MLNRRTFTVSLLALIAAVPAFADAIGDAKAYVAKYATTVTAWDGPTTGPKAAEAFGRIGRASMDARFSYATAHVDTALWQQSDEAALRQQLAQALDSRLQRDMERGFTSVGPQADDVTIELGAAILEARKVFGPP